MEKRQRVIVHGNTVVLAGIEARLRLDPNTEVIGHALTGSQQEMAELHPDVVIFDLDEMQPEFLQIQFQSQPDLLLIGIDPENHEVLLTGQAARSITLDQIIKIVRSRDQPSAEESVTSSPDNQPVDIRKTSATEFLQEETINTKMNPHKSRPFIPRKH